MLVWSSDSISWTPLRDLVTGIEYLLWLAMLLASWFFVTVVLKVRSIAANQRTIGDL